MARITNEQLAEILARKGYGLAGGVVPNPNRDTPQMPVAQCSPVNGPLAKTQGEEAGPARLLVRVKVYRKIPTDFDNQFIKWHVDCLRYCGIIRDDRQCDIRLEIAEQIKVRTDAEEQVEIEIIAPGGSVEADKNQEETI